jgi:hypothetical protein
MVNVTPRRRALAVTASMLLSAAAAAGCGGGSRPLQRLAVIHVSGATPLRLKARLAGAVIHRRGVLPVLRPLAAVERAYDAGDAGDVRRLCRPSVLVDPAVIRAEDAQPRGCEAPLEDLMANVPRVRLTVLEVTLRPDLATATVAAANGSRAAVDFVRRGRRWLLSFSDGDAPLPALAGTT